MSRPSKISLCLIFALCALLSTSATWAQVAGQNVNMVSGTSWPGGDPFLQRQNEPSMAVSTRNPMHILAGANDYRTVDLELALSGGKETGDSWLGLFKSFDGGLTWQSTLLPGCKYGVSDCQDSNGHGGNVLTGVYDAGSDPVVRAGTNGMFYYVGLAFDRNTGASASQFSSIFVARYNDLNNNENIDPIRYIDTRVIASGNPSQFLDKPALAVDIPRAGASSCSFTATEPGAKPADPPVSVNQTFPAGNVYVAYTDFTQATKDNSTPTHLMFTRSVDCGVTWGTPVQINSGSTTSQGSAIAVNPVNGNVYVTWRQFASTGISDAIMVAQSTNGGRTFSAPVRISTFQPFDQGTSTSEFRTNAYPSITTDMFGFVYVAFSGRGLGPGGDARVVATGSLDGTHWTPAIMVDNPKQNAQTNPSGRGHQIMPAITFANGRLTLLYYDLRFDHYENIYSSNGKGTYTPTLTPEGELASPAMPSKVFTPFIDDAGLTLRRHTIDLRVLQLGIFPTITLGPSVSVTQYDYGCCVTGTQDIEQFKFNVPNLPLFALGTQPFLGDYIEVVPSPLFVPNGSSWAYNFVPSVNPLFHATWTDNRDVIPPANHDWTHYTPAVPNGTPSVFQSGQTLSCTPGQEGMRNQNIYTSQITGGLIVGAPGNAKQLGTTKNPLNNQTVPFQRAFAVEAQNVTNQSINVRFSIANQPTGGKASFLQFLQLTTLDITIPALSSVSRSVFVTSTNQKATVTVNVVQIGSIGGSPVSNGLSSSAVLNPDVTNPNITNPNITNLSSTNPNITNLEVTNPNITNPNITNPNITNPNITNPNITNPNITNPNITNPNITNPNITNPNITNPNITNPNITNPNITNPNITNNTISNGAIQDVSYPITNTGNTTASYTVQIAQTGPLGGVAVQLIVNKLYQTPSANDCKPTVQTHWVTVANITNPKLYDVSVPAQRNQLGNPNITNSTPNEASVTLAPGETAYITLRVISPTPTPVNPLTLFVPVTVPQAVNTQTALANPGVTILPPVTVPPLTITTATLPDSIVGHSYNATLAGQGGNPGADTWSISSGTLPTGLSLNAATGVIGGTTTTAGNFTFAIQLKDTAIGTQFPQHTTNPPTTFTVHVVSPLTLTPAAGALPGGTQGTPYNQTISPVGGLAPITISQTAGAVPAGLTFTNGVIGGIPSGTGPSSFTVQAADSSNPHQVITQVYSINIVASVPVPGNVTFLTQPPNYTGGQTSPNSPIQVHVVDNAGAVMAATNVTMSLNGTPPCSTALLSGTLTKQTNQTGDAFFGDLSVDRGQIGYALKATVVGTTVSGISNPFTVNGFCGTGSSVARANPTATLLQGGTVLVAGGATDQGPAATAVAEIYNPANGTFAATTGNMTTPRVNHTATATLLNNGTVLIVGGQSLSTFLATAEIYNPTLGTFTNITSSLNPARSGHTATLLADGTVLIAGGISTNNVVLTSAEIYDPNSQIFTPVGAMNSARYSHTATLLANGKVLIATGLNNSAELYDPVTQAFSNTGPLTTTRQNPSATLLPNGQVLIAGGLINGSTGIESAELYDPVAGTFSQTGNLNTARGAHTATLLTDGTVLIAGGFNVDFNPDILASAEIYNPAASTFTNTGSLIGIRWQHTATLLNDGSVLIAGGFGGSFLASAERYFSTAPLAPMLFTTTANPANGTTVSSNSTAFSQNASGISLVGFDGILPAGTPFTSSNPLLVSGVSFTATGAAVDLTTKTFYSPNNYASDFIVDSSNSNPTNQVTIVLPQPTNALGIDYGGLGFSGASTGNITLSNGFVLSLASLPTVGTTQFSGFVSPTPFSSLTYTVTNDHWIVTDLLLATANLSLPDATETTPYGYVLLQQGGVGPLTWTLANGTLPNGLSLSLSGVISGTPAVDSSGTYTFAVHVKDSSNPPKNITSGNLSLRVVPQNF